MKSNTKKVINIVLTLAMIFSMMVALGSVAMAAPVLGEATAAFVGDTEEVTIDFVSSEAGLASLRAIIASRVDGEWVESDKLLDWVAADQYSLVEAANSLSFAIAREDLQGEIIKIIVAGAPGTGTTSALLAVDVDRYSLGWAFKSCPAVPEDQGKYTAETWAIFKGIYDAAVLVDEDEFASQAEVDAACEALSGAIRQLNSVIVGIKIDAIAATTVSRNTTYTFDTILDSADPGHTLFTQIVWSTNMPAYATVLDAEKGIIKINNLPGTAILTVTDKYTGLSATIVLRII